MTSNSQCINREQDPISGKPDSGECSLSPAVIEALMEFFCARSAVELKMAFTKAGSNNDHLPWESIEWQRVEYEFNRLFVGPAAPVAPPYASVYMDEKPDLMGSSTIDIRRLYHSMGLKVPDQGEGIPDDFISYELDALLVLLGQQPLNLNALDDLVSHHMMRWIPAFCRRCRQAEGISGPVLIMVNLLESTITDLSHALSGTKKDQNESQQ